MAIPNQTSVVQKNTNNYPTHKTVSLVEEKAIVNTEAPVQERESRIQQPLSVPPVTTPLTPTAYPTHKTVDIVVTADTTPPVKETPTEQKTTNTAYNPIVNKAEQSEPQATRYQQTTNSYPVHKTVTIPIETPAINKIEPIVPKQEPIQEARTITPPIVQPTVTNTVTQSLASGTYPVHKTVSLSQQDSSVNTITPPVKEEQKVPVIEQKATTITNITPVTTNPENKIQHTDLPIPNSELSTTSYPAHKTYSFTKEEPRNENQETRTKSQEQTSVTVPKQETISQESSIKNQKTNPQTPASGITAKPKKPVLWIALCSVLFLLALAASWYGYSKQEEITTLKAGNEVLEENVQRLQKDLFIDDIIARGGKIDAKNNITVTDVAANSEALRVCFSVAGNPRAKAGKKTIYIRITDSANNALTASKENTFEYKREQLPYTAKETINYKNDDMMLCVDYKPTQKLQKGAYKAEIYSEGVLDGSTTFELK